MRDKGEILSESLAKTHKVPDWDSTASLHERLIIEVLIDIRDILKHLFYWLPNSEEKDP